MLIALPCKLLSLINYWLVKYLKFVLIAYTSMSLRWKMFVYLWRTYNVIFLYLKYTLCAKSNFRSLVIGIKSLVLYASLIFPLDLIIFLFFQKPRDFTASRAKWFGSISKCRASRTYWWWWWYAFWSISKTWTSSSRRSTWRSWCTSKVYLKL